MSWRIIGDDFTSAIEQLNSGRTVELLKKTASYIDWGNSIKTLRESGRLNSDADYWQSINERIEECNSGLELNNTEDYKSDSVSLELNEKVTYDLFYKSNNAFNTEINDLLLCSLVKAFHSWKQCNEIAVNLESHGREEAVIGLNIDNTVGWFTSSYPIILQYESDIDRNIVSTKEMIRNIPNKGITYGILYADAEPKPEITFNYLGQVGGSGNTMKYTSGEAVSSENKLPGNISFNCYLSDEKFTFIITYNKLMFSAHDMRILAEAYLEALEETIAYCSGDNESRQTISDLSDNELSDDELEMLNDFYDF